MNGDAIQPLLQALVAKKPAIIQAWLGRTLQTYPEHTSRFLLQEKVSLILPMRFPGIIFSQPLLLNNQTPQSSSRQR